MIQIAKTHMNIATAGMHLTSQINVQFVCWPLRSHSQHFVFLMVTHLISFIFYHPYNVPLHTAYRKIENLFFTAAIQIYCDAITEQRYNQHTRCSSDRESSSTILALLIRFVKKTAWVQELTYRNKAYKQSKTLFFIINKKTMSCPVTLSIPTPAQITYTVPYKAYGM